PAAAVLFSMNDDAPRAGVVQRPAQRILPHALAVPMRQHQFDVAARLPIRQWLPVRRSELERHRLSGGRMATLHHEFVTGQEYDVGHGYTARTGAVAHWAASALRYLSINQSWWR